MVICKYYRQGNCRYGQYCQFEHINHFVNTKNEDDIIILVAKEVLLAERGGQWLLSCFAPLKERPCIPDMDDVSPEEIRWELYHAQKNGMVEQAKLHYQQLCQDMKAKREMLKNPTRETVTLLKKILGGGQKGGLNAAENAARKSSTLSFAAPQLNLVNNTSTNNVFGSTAFGVQNNNLFGGGGFTPSTNASSIFGKPNSTTPSVFGAAATFGNNLGGFGTATSGAGTFFGTTSTSTSYSGAQNSAPAFGTPQNNPIFGGSSQNVFGQNSNVFGGTAQLGNASTTSLFNNPITSQANTSLFGGATTTASNLFGGAAAGLQTNPVFGVSTTSSSGSFNGGGIFAQQPKTQIPAFGGAPVFAGVTPNYANNSAGNSIFGGGQAFGAPAISTNSIFGASAVAATSAFGAAAVTTTPAFGTSVTTPGFGASAVTAPPAFDLNPQPGNPTFGTTVSTPNVFGAQNTDAISFGSPAATISGPFVTTSSQQFDSTSVSSAPFAGAGFGLAVASTNNTFGTTETSSNSIFANAGTFAGTSNGAVPNSSPFPAFGGVNASSPFGSTAGTTVTAAANANPFAPRMEQGVSPFGIAQNQSNINASPFVKLPFNTPAVNTIIDDNIYSLDSALTDDEKNMFLCEKFIIGKIPLKPPTKDIR